MRVLVTGQRGYIGVEMVPVLRAAGHDVVGLDTGLYDGCDFGGPPDEIDALDVDLRDVLPEHLEGFDAVVHLAALSNDPLGDLNADLTYDINLHASVRLARGREGSRRRPLPVRIVVQPVRRWWRAVCSTSTPRSIPSPRTASRKSGSSVRSANSPTTRSRLSTCATRPRTACHAGFAPTSWSTTSSGMRSRAVKYSCRATAHRGAHSSTSATSSPPSSPASRRPVRRSTTRRSTSARAARTIASGTSPSSCKDVVPGCEVVFAPGASPDTRNYRIDFSKVETKLPGFSADWTLRRGVEELYEAFVSARLSADDWTGPRYYRLAAVQRLQQRGELDAELRRAPS